MPPVAVNVVLCPEHTAVGLALTLTLGNAFTVIIMFELAVVPPETAVKETL